MDEVTAMFDGMGKLIASVIAFGSFLLVSWRRIATTASSVWVLVCVHRRLGNATADEIYEAIQSMRKAHCALDVRQQMLERHCNVGVYVSDSEGRTVWANEVLCEMHGLDLGSIRGFGWLAAVVEIERFEVHRRWIECVRSDVPWSSDYTVQNQRTHEKFRCHTEAHAIAVDGEPACFVGTVKRIA